MRQGRLVWLLFVALLACNGAGSPGAESPSSAVEPEAPPPAPRNADDLARQIVGAKIGVLVHMDRVRNHPLAPRLVALATRGGVLDGTGIDPLRDVSRAFVAAANARDGKRIIVVAEHDVPPDRVKAALQVLVDRSGREGGWLDGYAVPAARISVKGRQSVVMAVSETLLVVTSESVAKAALVLAKSGGLPEPTGEGAVTAHVEQPHDALNAGRMPPIPETIRNADAEVRLLGDGSASIDVVGHSRDAAQAEADAAALNKSIDDATSMKMGVLRIRLFQPIAFHAEGSSIKAQRALSQAELERLIGLLEMLTPD